MCGILYSTVGNCSWNAGIFFFAYLYLFYLFDIYISFCISFLKYHPSLDGCRSTNGYGECQFTGSSYLVPGSGTNIWSLEGRMLLSRRNQQHQKQPVQVAVCPVPPAHSQLTQKSPRQYRIDSLPWVCNKSTAEDSFWCIDGTICARQKHTHKHTKKKTNCFSFF